MSFSSLSGSSSSFASAITATTPTSSSSYRKRVSFANVEVIELPMTVGEGPSIGVPLTVDWKPQERNTFPLDFFEKFRPQRRVKHELRVGPESRERLLLKNGCTEDEILLGTKNASTLRKDRWYTVQQLHTLKEIESSFAKLKACDQDDGS